MDGTWMFQYSQSPHDIPSASESSQSTSLSFNPFEADFSSSSSSSSSKHPYPPPSAALAPSCSSSALPGSITEWSKVESCYPLCKQRFKIITKNERAAFRVDLRNAVIPISLSQSIPVSFNPCDADSLSSSSSYSSLALESCCTLCEQRFRTITKNEGATLGVDLRDVYCFKQVYEPSEEEEISSFMDPYENVICTECHKGGDDYLMISVTQLYLPTVLVLGGKYLKAIGNVMAVGTRRLLARCSFSVPNFWGTLFRSHGIISNIWRQFSSVLDCVSVVLFNLI